MSKKNIALLTIGITILLAFFLPTWLSLPGGRYFYLGDNASEIGDAIGGITAPLIGISGAILVYLALLSQIEANKEIRNQFKDQNFINYINTQHSLIRDDIQLLVYEYKDNKGSHSFKGSYMIFEVLMDSIDLDMDSGKKYPLNTYLQQVKLTIEGLLALIREIENSEVPVKKHLINPIFITYQLYIGLYLEHIMTFSNPRNYFNNTKNAGPGPTPFNIMNLHNEIVNKIETLKIN